MQYLPCPAGGCNFFREAAVGRFRLWLQCRRVASLDLNRERAAVWLSNGVAEDIKRRIQEFDRTFIFLARRADQYVGVGFVVVAIHRDRFHVAHTRKYGVADDRQEPVFGPVGPLFKRVVSLLNFPGRFCQRLEFDLERVLFSHAPAKRNQCIEVSAARPQYAAEVRVVRNYSERPQPGANRRHFDLERVAVQNELAQGAFNELCQLCDGLFR